MTTYFASILNWFKALFFSVELEVCVVGLQASGKTVSLPAQSNHEDASAHRRRARIVSPARALSTSFRTVNGLKMWYLRWRFRSVNCSNRSVSKERDVLTRRYLRFA